MTGEMHIHSTKKSCEVKLLQKQNNKRNVFVKKKLDGTSVRFRM